MDIGTFRGITTVVLMVLFVALVFWAYSRKRKQDFDAAALLPLEDDDDRGHDLETGTEKR